jgi:hypothetical protein
MQRLCLESAWILGQNGSGIISLPDLIKALALFCSLK